MSKTATEQRVIRVPRMVLPEVTPRVHEALIAFTLTAEENLDPIIASLVKVRVSQLNGCAFCLDLHSRAACGSGESEQRISALPDWRDSNYFADRERAALALTEAVTFVAEGHVPEDTYDEAARFFDRDELAHLLWTIAAVNAWTRLGVATRMPPSSESTGRQL